jgi:hypothetical protein
MMLTPVEDRDLPWLIESFAAELGDSSARRAFERIAGCGEKERAAGARAARHHRDALRVLAALGMATRPGSPAKDFSWDGHGARIGTEAYVLRHEAAHFQLAAPARRHCVDFGLGPGPETGWRHQAERHAQLFDLAREREEAMASLLGILWEAELGHPALASFLDQNWLEGAPRPSTLAHFETVLNALRDGGFITPGGRPTGKLRPL